MKSIEVLETEYCAVCDSQKSGVEESICPDCTENGDYAYCGICKEHYSREAEWCRHIFWSDCGDFGAGSYDWDECREPFFKLLDFLDTITDWHFYDPSSGSLVKAMEARIAADDFWTFYHGFMLSMPNLAFKRANPWHPEDSMTWANISARHFTDFEHRDPEGYAAAADGYGWLASLEADNTKQANARTVRWIMEWRLQKHRNISEQPT